MTFYLITTLIVFAIALNHHRDFGKAFRLSLAWPLISFVAVIAVIMMKDDELKSVKAYFDKKKEKDNESN